MSAPARRRVGSAEVSAVLGDISRCACDAIVNAANSALAGGGGVDGAIHDAGGPEILAELDRLRPPRGCPTGSAVVTGAGRLAARWVVHAVGPRWRGGNRGEEQLLASAYVTSLRLAAEKGAKTVSLPAISTGIYGYPLEKAAPVAVAAVCATLAEGLPLTEVCFVLFDEPALAAYSRALLAWKP